MLYYVCRYLVNLIKSSKLFVCLVKLYVHILFDINNFENENIIKYYTIDRYFFQMKSYVHNFLIFLAQSFGADKINLSLSSQVSTHDTNEVNVSAGSHGVTGEAGGSSGTDTENRMSNNCRDIPVYIM